MARQVSTRTPTPGKSGTRGRFVAPVVLSLCAALVAGCGDSMPKLQDLNPFAEKEVPLQGKRVSVIQQENITTDAVAANRPIVLPQPVYPRAARAARQSGRVMVCFTLDERGLVHTPAVRASTDPVFNQPVLDAINAARFRPARVGKQAVRSTACRTFKFVLR